MFHVEKISSIFFMVIIFGELQACIQYSVVTEVDSIHSTNLHQELQPDSANIFSTVVANNK